MNDTKCSESLAELYRLLNEEDMRCGLWKKMSVTAETKAGLSLVQHDFGKTIENYEILLDSLWKLPDWAYMKDHVIPKTQVRETPKLCLIQAFFALHDRNANGVGDAGNIVRKGVDLASGHWWQLPKMSLHARVSLLQQFQQLVEVQESAKIFVDIANGNKLFGNPVVGVHGNLYADFKDILET
ncbi:hypothetical protein REPUB_Repub20aG0079300 [Reevesia pubescens]